MILGTCLNEAVEKFIYLLDDSFELDQNIPPAQTPMLYMVQILNLIEEAGWTTYLFIANVENVLGCQIFGLWQ